MSNITRRSALGALAGGMAAAAVTTSSEEIQPELKLKGNIKQSVSKWCFGDIPLEQFCRECKKLGMVGIDLVGPK
ncbi:twin-arginine translocation signal domain-containing protein, partial [bacterium]|nr:twin-arginine translocation signal domain-containing protein [bacterium]